MRLDGLSTYLAVAILAGATGAAVALLVEGSAREPLRASVPEPSRQAAFAGPQSLADAAARIAPAVVSIYAYPLPASRIERLSSGTARREIALGSGVLVSAGGLAVTNRHVVKDAGTIRVALADGRALSAIVLGLDRDTDLAAIKVEGAGLPTAPVGDPSALRIGEPTLAIGNPYGMGQTVTQGVVSALGRQDLGLTPVEHFIQTDAAINPGCSGGALVNARGELVGINTAIYSESGASSGIGFAIPADLAVDVARSIARHGRVERGWLGVRGRSLTPSLQESFALRVPRGVLVSSTLPNSPAERAGLRPGDVVTRVGDRAVGTLDELQDAVSGAGPRRALSLEIWRGSARIEASALTDDRPVLGD
jgi:S1-C subfamily serine protease